ncbi:hypothetical protein ABIF26_006462 [Bradyrhizobium elkanii]|jgi:hypothetical protein|uniref:hypothetical protein n=1 Tax=Bradyrhizobium elkanii TaxID=29448 RepID=UPI002168D8EF|nr:hypothetical protein [Bradyrhizobium elkanii]MCS3690955.1 hypothetical protein [Bradyrhizobium elkanii]
MADLDHCINDIFEPGNIGSSVGTPPVKIIKGTIYTPDDYPVDGVTYSLDFTKFYNSPYLGAF